MENKETTEIKTEKILAKIKGLLAKGQGTDNLHEKAIFIAKAHQMMAEHNITLVEDKEEGVYEQKVSEGTQTVSTMRKTMTKALAKHFGCDYYFTTSREYVPTVFNKDGTIKEHAKTKKVQRMVFVGSKMTVDTFIMTFDFCWEAFIQLSGIILKTECEGWDRGAKIQFKEDYLVGFVDGIVNELILSINKYGLVVTVPQKVKDHMNSINFKGTVSTKSLALNVKNGGAVKRGYNDGAFATRGKNTTIV